MEALSDGRIQVRIRIAKDDPDRPPELWQLKGAMFLTTGVENTQMASGGRAWAWRSSRYSVTPAPLRGWTRQGPVNRRWTRGVVRDEDDLLKPQLGHHGFEVADCCLETHASA
jgi:hypothetical protein